MTIVQNIAFYLVAVPAVLVVGIGKGGFAGGLGIVAVPLMALTTSPQQAASIMLPILCVMDLTGVRMWLNRWDRHLMKVMLPGAIVGIFIGSLMFEFISDTALKMMIGVLALAFTLNHWFKGRIKTPRTLPDRAVGTFWSAVSGFTSFLAHAGGPPIMIYLLPKNLDKAVMVGTVTIFFAIVNYAKLIPYALLGQLDAENMLTSLVLAPVAVIGVKLGIRLHDRIDPQAFYRLMYVFLFLTGLKLTWDGVSRLMA